MIYTVVSMGNFSILLVLIMFVFSLMGMEFFADQLKFDENDVPLDVGVKCAPYVIILLYKYCSSIKEGCVAAPRPPAREALPCLADTNMGWELKEEKKL